MKPINYSKLSAVMQEEQESPSAFLERLREALVKHTYMSPEVQVILKDKFITQSAPDIRRKLQILAYGPEQSLESLLKVATSVFYNRDKEEKRDRDRRDNRKAEALAMALQS